MKMKMKNNYLKESDERSTVEDDEARQLDRMATAIFRVVYI